MLKKIKVKPQIYGDFDRSVYSDVFACKSSSYASLVFDFFPMPMCFLLLLLGTFSEFFKGNK